MIKPTVSIIICTRDRADDLEQALASLHGISIPKSPYVELVVVDNGSTDNTAEIVRRFHHACLPVRYVYEERRGKGHAYNAAISVAQGRVLLFSDDDVRFPHNWIEGMCTPILRGEADALAGGVRIAKHLERTWMEAGHRLLMAHSESLTPIDFEMIGANMAFARHVLSKVPAFDPELGPGATGLGEDSLFHMQLVKAGYRVRLQQDVAVEHHFDPLRLKREAFLRRAEAMGRSFAYVAYHWQHKHVPLLTLRFVKATIGLQWCRTLAWLRREAHRDGVPMAELSCVSGFYFYKQYLRERQRPRNYEQYGLTKLH